MLNVFVADSTGFSSMMRVVEGSHPEYIEFLKSVSGFKRMIRAADSIMPKQGKGIRYTFRRISRAYYR